MVYFLGERGSNVSYISTYAGMYSAEEQQQLKHTIMEVHKEKKPTVVEWRLENLCGRSYFVRYIVFQNYYMILGMDVKAELGKWINLNLSKDAAVTLKDADRMLLVDQTYSG